jgi:small basic protein
LKTGPNPKDLGYFFIICPIKTKAMFCKNCGKQIDNDSKFCSYCGVSLTNEPTVITQEKKTHSFQAFPAQSITPPTPVSIDKYDMSFKKDDSLTTIGIVMLIIGIIGTISMQNEITKMTFDEFRTFQIVGIIVSLVVRVVVIGVVSQYANKLNRDSFLWGFFAFIVPAICLIVIGQQKKLKNKS